MIPELEMVQSELTEAFNLLRISCHHCMFSLVRVVWFTVCPHVPNAYIFIQDMEAKSKWLATKYLFSPILLFTKEYYLMLKRISAKNSSEAVGAKLQCISLAFSKPIPPFLPASLRM